MTESLLTPAELPRYLTGDTVRLVVVDRRVSQGELWYSCWQVMREEAVIASYFHDDFAEAHGPYRGDLPCFIQHYCLQTHHLVLVALGAHDMILGMVDYLVTPRLRHAKAGIWFRRKQSAAALEAGLLATSLGFAFLQGIDTFFAMSPHPYIPRYGRKLGWQELPPVAGYYGAKPLYMIAVTRATWDERLQHAAGMPA